MDDMRLSRWAMSAASPKPATACRRFTCSAFSGKLCEARQLWTMVRAPNLSRGEADGSTRVHPGGVHLASSVFGNRPGHGGGVQGVAAKFFIDP